MQFSLRKYKEIIMDTPKKSVYTKPRQYEILVEFMTRHSDLAKGHLNASNARSKSRELWQKLAQDLNAAGPPTHEIEKWKKVWADYKQHIKVKSRRNKNSLSGTGGGPSNYCSLTALEQQTAELLSIDEYVEGINGASRFGAYTNIKTSTHNTENNIEDNYIIQESIDISCNDSMANSNEQSSKDLNVTTPRRRTCSNSSSKDMLLQKQVENQIKYQESSIQLLNKLEENQKSCLTEMKEINKNLSTNNKYLKRKSDLNERIYKLKREKFEFLKKNEIEKTKRKVAQLELKQKMFELECKKYGHN